MIKHIKQTLTVKRKGKEKMKKYYDVEMIRDFIEHLKWELTINVHENQGNEKVNPELVEMLTKYQSKWNTMGLMPALELKGFTQENGFDIQQATESFKQARAKMCQDALDAFKKLEDVFQDAFDCASHPDMITMKIVTPENKNI